jgi:hypothetical protein
MWEHLVTGSLRLVRYHQHLINAVPIHIQDFNGEAIPSKRRSRDGNTLKGHHDEAA